MREFEYTLVHIPSGTIEIRKIQCWSDEEFKNKINEFNRLAALGVKSPVWLYYW